MTHGSRSVLSSTPFLYTGGDCSGLTNCTVSATPLQDAVNHIRDYGTIPSDGFIHVDVGAIPDQAVIIDGSLPYLNSLKGIVGHVDSNTLEPDARLDLLSDVGSFIYVENKLNGFSVTGLNIHADTSILPYYGAVNIVDSSGSFLFQDLVLRNNDPVAYGLFVNSVNGAVTLKNVQIDKSLSSGAYIDNSSLIAKVTVTNSSFSNNFGLSTGFTGNGLHIITRGAVSIYGINASGNAGTDPSLWIQNASSVTIKGGLFNENTASILGVNIDGVSGNITLQDVFADLNKNGINLSARGNISLTNVSASGNDNDGANLDTCWGTPCTNTTGSGKVTINGGNFNYNDGINGGFQYGLGVSARGAIMLTNVNANNNGTIITSAYGALLDTSQSNLNSPVMVTSSSFNHNYPGTFGNLTIRTKGAITLTKVHADYALSGCGALLDNSTGMSGVTIKGAAVDRNSFSQNVSDGLRIFTNGSVSLSYLGAYKNGSTGLFIATAGNISLSNLQVDDNASYGFHFETTTSSSNISIVNSYFYYNAYGIHIKTLGSISLTNTQVHSSDTIGAYLDNSLAATPKSVTIKNGWFSYNAGGYGLYVLTKGIISLNTLSAYSNGSHGVYLDQRPASLGLTPTFPVATISNAYIQSSADNGLTLYGRGTVKLTNITSNNNAGFGAYIENYSGNVSVLASGTSGGNDFSYNTGSHGGLAINSPGAIVLNKVTARGNSGAIGAFLYHFDGGAGPTGNVTINGGDYSYQDSGIVVYSKGSINVNNITANGNIIGGITLRNTSDTTGTKNVIVTRSTANSNGDLGLAIRSYGTITLNQITAVDNTTVGVSLDNTFGAFTTPKGISVLGSYGTSNINENGMTGLDIRTKGIVVISKLNANENTGDGIVIDNYQGGLGTGTISLTYVTANSNLIDGIDIWTNNAVALSNLKVFSNGFSAGAFGIDIWDTHNHNLKVTNSLISGNAGAGILAQIGSGIFTISNSFYVGNHVINGAWDIQIGH